MFSLKSLQMDTLAQMVKNLPAMWANWVQSLGREDLLKKKMPMHSSVLARKIPYSMDREAWGATVRGVARSQTRLSN